jgi:hypothetical protein
VKGIGTLNPYYLAGLTLGGLVGIYLISILFRYAILGRGGTKVQHLWVVMLTGVIAIGFSAFGDGTDGFTNRITNPPDMAQAIAYALSALVVAFFVWLRPDENQQPEGSTARKASIVGRSVAMVFVIPMILTGLGNLVGSAYSIALHGQPSPGLGIDRAEMRENMLNGEMAPFWLLMDKEAPSDLDYIIERIFADEERYSSEQDVMDKISAELVAHRVQMATYGPALTDAQRVEMIKSQSDFLRSFQDDPDTCAVVASKGAGALSAEQLSAALAVFNQSITTMMRLLIEARETAQDGATMPRAASEDDFAALVADMIETGTSEHELQVFFSENSADPAYCTAVLDFMDAVSGLPGPAGVAVRFEITQGILTTQ